MTIDTEGNLYLCQPGVNQILVRSPAGVTLGNITFPEAPANCTFGGRDMKTLFVAARTSIYVCQMAATGHRFAWNPASFADFQRKFFGATNAPSSARADDPDGDGASNELEYLTRTNPLDVNDVWRIGFNGGGGVAAISFTQIMARGFEIERHLMIGQSNGWQVMTNLPVSTNNRFVVVNDTISSNTNHFYRVRVFEP
jgi:hypothetical protein